MGSIPGLGKHFSPEYDCSLHQEQSLKSSWMIGEDLRRNTLAWYSCPDRCINARLRPEDHQLRLENFYAPYFPQMGHWNSVLCSRLNLDTIRSPTVWDTSSLTAFPRSPCQSNACPDNARIRCWTTCHILNCHLQRPGFSSWPWMFQQHRYKLCDEVSPC